MPRIDPLQLLKCLSVLLTPEGGILSNEEVPRLVNLMTKFSKKLVSKCIYMLILKNTELELVDMFMAEGGWSLIQAWMQDAILMANWDLVREIIGLLLVTPVDVERLKMNVLPKLIKNLSKREELEDIAKSSTLLVQQWLSIVKKTQEAQQELNEKVAIEPALSKAEGVDNSSEISEMTQEEVVKEPKIEYVKEEEAVNGLSQNNAVYKTSGKDGKLIIKKMSNSDDTEEGTDQELEKAMDKIKEEKSKEKSSSSSKSSRSSSSSKSRSKDSERDKDRKRSSSSSKSSSSKSSDKGKSGGSSSNSKSSSHSKDSDKKDKDKDRHKKSSSSSSRSSSSKSSSSKDKRDKDKDRSKESKEKSKSEKEKQHEKDQETLSKLKTPTIEKLGRIPKKTSEEKSQTTQEQDVKKKFSVGIRKDRDSEERPKTVKVFNSKMRSTGLEEEVKPAPPRNSTKKPTPSVQLPTIPSKRPSPPKEIREPIGLPEKKLKIDKIDVPERPGAIKLIPPKPKPAFLQESDIFSDALTAASTKKEPKKRKRRVSISKDTPTSPTSPASEVPTTPTSPSQTSNSGAISPLGLKNIAPINFYQDTLAQESDEGKTDEENKENSVENSDERKSPVDDEDNKDTPSSPSRTPTDDSKEDEPLEVKRPRLEGGLKGVLLYTKKKGPKKSIKWKNDDDLVEIKYFELDETERVNVSRSSFGDMAKMEMSSEREALQLSRKIVGEDLMETQISWRFPLLLDLPDPLAVPGSKSLEKDIQFAREKSVIQAYYFDKKRIPDNPEEPIPENHQMKDPIIIPLEDPESQDIDLRATPWPEPKGMAPQPETPPVQHNMFPNMAPPFQPPFSNMPPPGFQPMPQRFPGPGPGPMGPMGMAPGFMPPNIIPNGNMMPPNVAPPDMMNMNPNMFPPGPMQDGFGPPGPDFQMFNQHPPNMNMFPPNNFRPRGGMGDRGRGGFRGRGDGGGWVRMSGNNWKRGGGGGGNRGGRICKNIQNHGFCRNRDNCPFVHPQ